MSLIDITQLGERVETRTNPAASPADPSAPDTAQGDTPPPSAAHPGRTATLHQVRREDIVARAAAEVREHGPSRSTRRPGVAVRGFGEGCVVVALAGPIGRDTVEWLAGMLLELRPRATRELILDLAGITDCDHALGRLLGQVRMRHLVDGARVEVRNPPPALAADLGEHPSQEFTIHHDPAAPQPR